MSNLEKRLAEMPCPNLAQCEDSSWACTWTSDNTLASECPDCHGTGLRWPGLSRECPSDEHDPCTEYFGYKVNGMSYYENRDIPSCHGSGRVPDVTLEKVWPLLNDATGRHVIHIWLGIDDLWHIWPVVADKRFTGDTPKEATMAALLASVGERCYQTSVASVVGRP